MKKKQVIDLQLTLRPSGDVVLSAFPGHIVYEGTLRNLIKDDRLMIYGGGRRFRGHDDLILKRRTECMRIDKLTGCIFIHFSCEAVFLNAEIDGDKVTGKGIEIRRSYLTNIEALRFHELVAELIKEVEQ